jgi:Ca-activated chloride channel homolog
MQMRCWLIIALFGWMHLSAQKKTPPPKQTKILFVFDASKSMIAKYQATTRMDGAKSLFYKFVDSLSRDRSYQFALRMYGHTVKYPPGDCKTVS